MGPKLSGNPGMRGVGSQGGVGGCGSMDEVYRAWISMPGGMMVGL